MAGLKIAFISTFPPKICGISSFTRDLINGIKSTSPENYCQVIALTSPQEKLKYGPEVTYQVDSNNIQSYVKAADLINQSNLDVVSLQHEYGIFGGEMGDFILHLTSKLKKTLITTLHMVNTKPPRQQLLITKELIFQSHLITVMTKASAAVLIKKYNVNPKKIKIIPHGAPDVPRDRADLWKKKLGLKEKKVLTSINIVRQTQGIDLVIKALMTVVEKFPEVIYLVIGPDPRHEGKTHPYRQKLISLVKEMGLEKNVIFKNEYLPMEKVEQYLQATDIFLTPYRLEESSSGSLAYAVAAGKVCLSTPFSYAQEVLEKGRGKLVPFENYQEIGREVINLLSHPKMMEKISKKTYAYGRKMVWSEVAKKYLEIFSKSI